MGPIKKYFNWKTRSYEGIYDTIPFLDYRSDGRKGRVVSRPGCPVPLVA